MKSSVFVVLALAGISLSSAQDDGLYHPELYGGDDGSYHPSDEGRYDGSRLGRQFGQFGGSARGPFGTSKGGDQTGFASSLSSVSSGRPSLFIPNPVAPAVPQARGPVQNFGNDKYAQIVRQVNDWDPNAYHYLYETQNGINAEESGRIVDGTQARGYFEYTGDDGVKYRVDYTADENGFQPSGAHIPQP